MTIDEQITLLNDAENALLKRRVTTTDATEKEALTEAIEEVRDMRNLVNLHGLLDTAATLNQLAGVIEKATAALKTRPFDSVLGAYQSLLDRIGAAIGHPLRQARAAVAADEPTAASNRPRAAAARGAATTRARDTSAAAALAKQFENCEIRAVRLDQIDRFYVLPMTAGRATYQHVADRLGIPWWVVGAIHGLESTFSFETHLHNGDPLTGRTVNEPSGHPRAGQPPFTWLESAIDALTLKNLGGLDDWSIGPTLDRLEAYNGLGY